MPPKPSGFSDTVSPRTCLGATRQSAMVSASTICQPAALARKPFEKSPICVLSISRAHFPSHPSNMLHKNAQLSHLKYRPDIDGLRAIAVLSVVAFHAFPGTVKGGYIGVDVFFVISGFLISTIIFESLERGTFSFVEFYARRIRRIFPALILVLASSLVFGWFDLLPDEYAQLGKHVAAGAGFASNFVLWGESGYFDTSAETKPLLHLWSLGIEEQFYLTWPLLLWLAWRTNINLFAATLTITLISFYLNIEGVAEDSVATFYSPQTRIWELLCGALLAWVTTYKKAPFAKISVSIDSWIHSALLRNPGAPPTQFISNTFSVVGLLLLIWGFWKIKTTFSFPGYWALFPVFGTILIIAAGAKSWLNRHLLSHPVAVWVGLISYPLYLWHWPLLSFVKILSSTTETSGTRWAVVLLSFVLAWITYAFLERPLRQRQRRNVQTLTLVTLMLTVGVAGYYTYYVKGFPQRRLDHLDTGIATKIPKFHLPNSKGWFCDSLPPKAKCVYEGLKPSVVIVGDSHAPRIYSALRIYYKERGLQSAVYSQSGCPPLLNVERHTAGKTSRCFDRMTRALHKIIEDDTIKTVILVTRGVLYFEGSGFGDVEKNQPNVNLHTVEETVTARSNREVFEAELIFTIDALLKAGKTIAYLHQVPELGFDIRRCIGSRQSRLFGPFVRKHTPTPICAVRKSLFIARTKRYRKMIDSILAKYPSVHSVDPSRALCDNTLCYGAKDRSFFYTDDDHLSHRGARHVVNKLKREFDKF